MEPCSLVVVDPPESCRLQTRRYDNLKSQISSAVHPASYWEASSSKLRQGTDADEICRVFFGPPVQLIGLALAL
jgi:hypothetical protein